MTEYRHDILKRSERDRIYNMHDSIYTCKDKSGDILRILSKPFLDEDKTYVVTKDKNNVFQIKILKNLTFEHGVPNSLLDLEPIMHEALIPDKKSKYIDPKDYPHIVPYERCMLRETNEELTIISFPYYDDNGVIVINVRDSQNNLVMYSIGDLIFKFWRTESELSEFKTGARRSKDVDEYRYDLISPFGLRALARAHKEGEKHPRWNNEKGFPAHDYLNHIFDHLMKFMMGDRNENHMGKIMWGASQIEHGMHMWPHLNEGVLRKEGCLPPDNPDNGYWKDLK